MQKIEAGLEARDKGRLEERFERWLEAMESGDYEQGRGGMCFQIDPRANRSYCCLGVLDEVVFDEVFKPTVPRVPTQTWIGVLEDSKSKVMYPTTSRLNAMNLYEEVTLEEIQHTASILSKEIGKYPLHGHWRWTEILEGLFTRLDVLIRINDNSASFGPVLKVIRGLGWDKLTTEEAA